MLKKAALAISYQNSGDVSNTIVIKSESHNGVPVSTFNFREKVETRGDGYSRRFVYSGFHLYSLSDFSGTSDTRNYDANGFLSSFKDRRGNTTTYTREPNIGAITRLTHPDKSSRSMVYSDPANPYYLSTLVDERGFKTTYERDAQHRITRIVYPDGSSEAFGYNAFGQVMLHYVRNNNVTTVTYDARGLMTSSTDAAGNVRHYFYDERDRLNEVTNANQHTTYFAYNSRDETTQIAFPDGYLRYYAYGARGEFLSFTNELDKTWKFTYDDYLRILSASDPNNRTWSYSYQRPSQNPYAHTTSNWFTETYPLRHSKPAVLRRELPVERRYFGREHTGYCHRILRVRSGRQYHALHRSQRASLELRLRCAQSPDLAERTGH
jgi:YD repeat-containing protein